MTTTISLRAIGWVRGGRSEPVDDSWDAVRSSIELDQHLLSSDATKGLEEFSHIEVVFHFNRVPDDEIQSGARHPRGRMDWPEVGILAQRGKGRPNRIGVSVCFLEKVEGLRLHVRGLDAIDGTPVLDVKPVIREFLPRGDILEPSWAEELMRDYW